MVSALQSRDRGGSSPAPSGRIRAPARELSGVVSATSRWRGTRRFGSAAPRHSSSNVRHLADLALAVESCEAEEARLDGARQGQQRARLADAGYPGAVLVLGGISSVTSSMAATSVRGGACLLAALVQEGVQRRSDRSGVRGRDSRYLGRRTGDECGDHVTRASADRRVRDPVHTRRGLRGVAWARGRVGLPVQRSASRGIIVEATLAVEPGICERFAADGGESEAPQARPASGRPSAGSVFVNPEGDSAGRLIEAPGSRASRSVALRLRGPRQLHRQQGDATAADVVG